MESKSLSRAVDPTRCQNAEEHPESGPPSSHQSGPPSRPRVRAQVPQLTTTPTSTNRLMWGTFIHINILRCTGGACCLARPSARPDSLGPPHLAHSLAQHPNTGFKQTSKSASVVFTTAHYYIFLTRGYCKILTRSSNSAITADASSAVCCTSNNSQLKIYRMVTKSIA
jgi:hypothetical protein